MYAHWYGLHMYVQYMKQRHPINWYKISQKLVALYKINWKISSEIHKKDPKASQKVAQKNLMPKQLVKQHGKFNNTKYKQKEYPCLQFTCANQYCWALFNIMYKYFTVGSTHSEGLLHKSILRIPTFTSAFNIVWMKRYHCTRVRITVFCTLWTNPWINLKFYARWRFSLKRPFDWYRTIPTLEFVRHSL